MPLADAPPHNSTPSGAVSVIIPTFNEKPNVEPLIARLAELFGGVEWEVIFVDDDSPDGTSAEVIRCAGAGFPARCLRRIGRRGLASAVVEGALAARHDVLACMDADFQHDESLLPRMLDVMCETRCDVVIASRYVEGGGVGDWSAGRRSMSDFATRLSRSLVGASVTDPMSGFFMIRRDVFEACVYDLSQQGYKILLDILSSSPRALDVRELPYVFRDRRAGQSKLDMLVLAEYAFLIVEKLTKGLVPPRLVFFLAVGGLGLFVNLAVLHALGRFDVSFDRAQACAVFVSMAFNYVVNNAITYRDQRLRGARFAIGFVIFCCVCSVGAVASIGVGDLAIRETSSWSVAGVAGALIGAVFNFGVATRLVWGSRRRRPAAVVSPAASGL